MSVQPNPKTTMESAIPIPFVSTKRSNEALFQSFCQRRPDGPKIVLIDDLKESKAAQKSDAANDMASATKDTATATTKDTASAATKDMASATTKDTASAATKANESASAVTKLQNAEKEQDDFVEPILRPTTDRFIGNLKTNELRAQELYLQQLNSLWQSEEIPMDRDRREWSELSPSVQHVLKHVLAFFATADALITENLACRFFGEVQSNALRKFYTVQIHIEQVHADTYAKMLKALISDDKEREDLMNAIETIPCVQRKANWARKWIASSTSFAERLVAFALVEGVFFSGSFCVIFFVRDKLKKLANGVGHANEMIARDEALHCEFACHVYRHHLVKHLSQARVYEIVEECVENEIAFICEAIPTGILGLSPAQMTEYIKYVADYMLVELGYARKYNSKNPFPFMERIGLDSKANFFEKRPSEYQKATTSSKEPLTVKDLDF